ncbi:MAG: hypothetical protein LLG44_07765, partial [Chloroflexi bacterium]|nr:hypothetical protein [Chloroflexota bacterium]
MMVKRIYSWLGQHIELLLVILVALLAALPLFTHTGLLATRAGGDSPFLLQRTQQLVQNLKAGVFPARWMPDGAYGYGYPFYDFYASLPYYLAALLDMAGLGTLLSIKLTQALGMLLAALGSYWLARELCPRHWVGLVVAAVYTLAPFHLVNIYVRGDSLGEFYAMAWFPLVILGIYRLRRLRSPGAAAFLAFVFAALILSHNISALVFAPLALLFLVLTAFDRGVAARWRYLGAGMFALGLGLLLSLWFWLPALREQSLVQLQEQTTGYFNYAGHFRWLDMVQLKPIFDYTIDANRNPFQMGLAQTLLAAGGLIALLIQVLRRQRLASWQIGALITLLIYTFLITPWSKGIWEHVPLLPMVQFPWRLLSVQALSIALLTINLIAIIPPRITAPLAVSTAALVSACALLGLHPVYLPITNADVTSERLALYEVYSGNIGSTVRAEYLPRWTVPRPYISGELLGLPNTPLALQGAYRSAELLQSAPDEQIWQVDITERGLLAFPTTFYPGWQAEVDRDSQGIEPLEGLGLLGLRLEAGAHTVRLYFQPTTARRVTGYISLGAALLWLALLGREVRHRKLYRRALVISGCLCIGAVWIFWIPHTAGNQADLIGPLVQDFSWAPLLHHEPKGIRFGDAHLLDYVLDSSELKPGGSLELALSWEQPEPGYTFSVQLVAATAHLMEPAPVWAESSVTVGAETLALQLPADLPPGLYVLRFSASRDGVLVSPVNGEGVEMGLLASSPLRVT